MHGLYKEVGCCWVNTKAVIIMCRSADKGLADIISYTSYVEQVCF